MLLKKRRLRGIRVAVRTHSGLPKVWKRSRAVDGDGSDRSRNSVRWLGHAPVARCRERCIPSSSSAFSTVRAACSPPRSRAHRRRGLFLRRSSSATTTIASSCARSCRARRMTPDVDHPLAGSAQHRRSRRRCRARRSKEVSGRHYRRHALGSCGEGRRPAFAASLKRAAAIAATGKLVLFGIVPTGPHTGYGQDPPR